ncbi:MAG: hypothetical protein HYT03_02210 [Candidatus Harrisonbacteria bacterium]|nr:hypothetical protein [Candidatus Harrisonbacteria bacterium]
MIFKASHRFYNLKWTEPQYDGESYDSYLDLASEEMPLVEAGNLRGALEKAFNYVLAHPSKFIFQGMFLFTAKERPKIQLHHFRKHLHKTPPSTPVLDYHWVEVEPVKVIS